MGQTCSPGRSNTKVSIVVISNETHAVGAWVCEVGGAPHARAFNQGVLFRSTLESSTHRNGNGVNLCTVSLLETNPLSLRLHWKKLPSQS